MYVHSSNIFRTLFKMQYIQSQEGKCLLQFNSFLYYKEKIT